MIGAGPAITSAASLLTGPQIDGHYSGIASDPVRLGIWAAAEDGALARQPCFWSTQVARFALEAARDRRFRSE